MSESLFLGDFAIDNAFVLSDVLHLEFMPLFLVENLVITSNPNSPQDNAREKMPNFEPRFVFLPGVMSEHAALLVEIYETGVARCH